MKITRSRKSDRRGVILILVVVAILLLSLAIFGFAASMRTEYKAARANENQLRSQSAARSGIESVKAVMAQSTEQRQELISEIRMITLAHDENEKTISSFVLAVPQVVAGSERQWRMGLEMESAKINLGVLLKWDEKQPGHARNSLLKLPNMTEEIADAMLDWIDEDSIPRQSGAEAGYYSEQNPSYEPRNSIPQILDELMLVRGITRDHLFGNQIAFAGEPPADDESIFDDTEKVTGVPWVRFLTFRSAERNETYSGKARIDLNSEDLQDLHQQLFRTLDVDWANFIVAYRQFGKSEDSDSEKTEKSKSTSKLKIDLLQPAKFEIESLFDLIGTKVSKKNDSKSKQMIRSPINEESTSGIQDFFDAVTVENRKVIHGRINLVFAPREVLMAIPGIETSIVDRIISSRESLETPPKHAVWLLENRTLSLESMKKIEPYVTCRGEVVRSTVVGYTSSPKMFSHLEFVIDATGENPAQIYCKDIQDLGLAKNIVGNSE